MWLYGYLIILRSAIARKSLGRCGSLLVCGTVKRFDYEPNSVISEYYPRLGSVFRNETTDGTLIDSKLVECAGNGRFFQIQERRIALKSEPPTPEVLRLDVSFQSANQISGALFVQLVSKSSDLIL
jgi:hypothetical protein